MGSNTTARGELRINVSRLNAQQLRIDVEDTGIGIAEADLSKLFTPFTRLGAEKSAVEGTGIGLVITKQLIELMDGSLEVASQPGQGSTFSVTLQRVDENDRKAAGSQDALNTAQAATPSVKTVVYIEDNEVNRKVLQRALQQRPQLQVALATNEAGIAMVKSQLPELVLLDINLPGMSGFEVIEILKQDPTTRSIPVIACSANVMAKDIERSRECGFADYLTKPIDFKILYRLLDQHLGT